MATTTTKDTRYDEIALCAQNLDTILGFILNKIWRFMWSYKENDNLHSGHLWNHCVWTPNAMELEMTIFVIVITITNWTRQLPVQSNNQNDQNYMWRWKLSGSAHNKATLTWCNLGHVKGWHYQHMSPQQSSCIVTWRNMQIYNVKCKFAYLPVT